MEDLKEKIDLFLSKIVINSNLLLKITAGILILNSILFIYNMYFNYTLYNKFKHKVNENKVLVVDNNGNQYFQRIGYLTEDTILNFAILGVRNIMEYSYINKTNLIYAKKYASVAIQSEYSALLSKEQDQLDLDEGFYTIKFKHIRFLELNETNETWKLEAWISKKYNGLGITNTETIKKVNITIQYKNNIISNPLGLFITEFVETAPTELEIEKFNELFDNK
jgi:hypothetical protein